MMHTPPHPLLSLAPAQVYPSAALYIVAMPIGNAADITLRALHVLDLVDVIAAEDTRHSAPLLKRYGINKPLFSAHQHNEQEAAARVIQHLEQGERVAYIPDAGTPGFSDPGSTLVEQVRAAGKTIVPIPGCNALATALSVAGEGMSQFTFLGFLPPKTKLRGELLHSLVQHPYALALYEAPHRIIDTLAACIEAFGGERRIFIARELSKLHETLYQGTLAEGLAWLTASAHHVRGEFVLLVQGASACNTSLLEDTQYDHYLGILLDEVSVRTAAKITAALTGASRTKLYTRALALKEQQEGGEEKC